MTVRSLQLRLRKVLDAADAAKQLPVARKRPAVRKRPFQLGDNVRVVNGPDRGTKGHILRIELDSRGLRVSRCALDTDFGTCIRVVANNYLRRTR